LRSNPCGKEEWIASSQELLAMTATHTFAASRREARAMPEIFALEIEGVGNAERSMHPQSRMRIL
jgi:hypothetical protein